MGNKPSTTTTTQTQTKTPWQSSYLNDITKKASGLASDPTNFKPLYSDLTNQGIDTLARAGQNGSAAETALGQVVPGSTAGFGMGLGQLASVAGGDYLTSNPYFQQVLDDTASRVNSQFTAAGRYGSGAHAGALARGLGSVAAQNYATERGNQDAAARTLYGGGFTGGQLGTTLDQASLFPAQVQLQAGKLRDQQLNAARTAPMTALEWQSGITNPIAQMGGTQSNTSTSQTVQPVNWLTTGLGIGQMGLGLLSGNPMMMAGGAGRTAGGIMGNGSGGKPSGWGTLGAF